MGGCSGVKSLKDLLRFALPPNSPTACGGNSPRRASYSEPEVFARARVPPPLPAGEMLTPHGQMKGYRPGKDSSVFATAQILGMRRESCPADVYSNELPSGATPGSSSVIIGDTRRVSDYGQRPQAVASGTAHNPENRKMSRRGTNPALPGGDFDGMPGSETHPPQETRAGATDRAYRPRQEHTNVRRRSSAGGFGEA